LRGPTPSQTIGPFFGFALPYAGGPSIFPIDVPGALRIEGRVLDGHEQPVADALLEVWQANAPSDGFGRCRTDAEGAFWFSTVKPGRVSTPGGMTQAPHLTITVFARGLLRHLVTRMYFPDGSSANAEDPVLRLVDPPRRRLLVAERDESGVLHFDVRLQGDRETPFFAV
jgi:protocatechuate 3,4-dioxygenase alpha subunit